MFGEGDPYGKSIYFIAPSTRLKDADRSSLENAVRLLGEGLKTDRVALSPFLFTRDEYISHVTASVEERSREFREAVREREVIVSVAGGTGAEDLMPTLDGADFRAIRKQKPLFIGFSDFAFLLNEVYSRCGVPGILFPPLRLNAENAEKLLSLIRGEEVSYRGSYWLSDPPGETVTGVPIGGNLTTFVNFLNREKPPRLKWRDHVLFFEDIGIDLEDFHRLLAALRRHRVFRNIRGLVIGSLVEDLDATQGKELQDRALSFLLVYLESVLRKRRERGSPLPMAVAYRFGHNITTDLPAVPIGGRVSLSPSLDIAFRMR